MGWFSNILTKASTVTPAMVFTPGQPIWTKRNYANLAREAYVMNVVGFRCIERIADAVGMVTWEAWKENKQLDQAPILELIAHPSVNQSFDEYIKELVSYTLISGNHYVEHIEIGGVPKEIYNLRPDRMTITPAANGIIQKFTYEVGSNKVHFEADNDGYSAIYHGKTFNPTDDWYGLSPIEPGAFAVDQHTEAMAWVQSLLQNSARPSGALVTGKDVNLGDDAFARLKKQMEDQYQGSNNAGRPMLLEGGLDWKAMGLSPSDMELLNTKNSAARDICLAFGVPPQLLGIPGDNTYANYQEARLAFWEDTVVPMINFIKNGHFMDLQRRFDDGVELRDNLDHIPAIADKKAKQWEMANASSDLTIDERRELKGYPPLPDGKGEVIFVPSSNITLEDAKLGLGDITPPNEDDEDDDDLTIGDDEDDDEEEQKLMRLIYGA